MPAKSRIANCLETCWHKENALSVEQRGKAQIQLLVNELLNGPGIQREHDFVRQVVKPRNHDPVDLVARMAYQIACSHFHRSHDIVKEALEYLSTVHFPRQSVNIRELSQMPLIDDNY